MKPRVLSLCDRTGVMVEPWVEAGFHCTIVDIQHTTEDVGPLLRTVGADVRRWEPSGGFGIVFAFPPCTHLASSGARWFRDKGLGKLIEALELVEACRKVCEAEAAPWMVENPMGTLSTYWRPPDFTFDPSEFAGYLDDPTEDGYTKRTCLWTGGGFQLPRRRPWEATQGSKMHLLAPSADRADLRSVTPRGFARAVFEANVNVVLERVA